MKSQTSKTNDEMNEQTASMSEMADALRKNCEQALRSGLKLQEEAARWWGSVFNVTTCAQQWQEQLNAATRTANSLLPLTQKPLSEMIEFLEKSTRSTAQLVKKASEAAQAPAAGDSQAKWAEFWTASLSVARTNAEAFSQINSKAIDSWSQFVRSNSQANAAHTGKAE
jgi:hypothetical protein